MRCFLQFAEVTGGMLAQRTDEVSWQFISLVDVAADLTDPTLGLLLGSGLDVGLVIVVGNRRYVVQDRRLGDVAKEHPVRTHVHGGIDLQGQEGVGALGQVRKTVGSTLTVLESLELVRISAGLESEVPEQIEGRRFTDDGNRELAGLLDDVMSKVQFIDCNRYLVWICRDLRHGVDDTAIIFFIVFRCQNEQPVRQLLHTFIIHFENLLYPCNTY